MNTWTSPQLGVRFDMTEGELQLFGPDGRRFLPYQALAEEHDRLARERDQIAHDRDQIAHELDAARAGRPKWLPSYARWGSSRHRLRCERRILRSSHRRLPPMRPSVGNRALGLHDRQFVERFEPVVGQRVVVHEKVRAADEKGPGAGDVEVIERLDGVRADASDPDYAGEGAEGVARLELTGLGPAEVSSPEPVIDAAHDGLAVGEQDPQGLGRRVAVEVHDGLEAQAPGCRILAEDLIADLDGFDRAGAAQGADRSTRGEAGPDGVGQICATMSSVNVGLGDA